VLITKEVEVRVDTKGAKYYEDKGYIIPKRKDKYGKLTVSKGTTIKVKVEDLSKGSKHIVDAQCDCCGKTIENIKWDHYLKYGHKDGKYNCQQCVNAGYKKWTSFYDWCYENLSKEYADNIIERWDYDKNIKNGKVLSPKDVSYASAGFSNKGYWFKCLNNPNHESELKNTGCLTQGKQNTIDCHQCNSIAETHPELIKYLVNQDDAYKYSVSSTKKIPMKCPNCGYERKRSMNDIKYQGFACSRCSDGISYPEKFLFNVLEQTRVNFVVQLSKKIFEWCKDYRYDIYVENFHGIIEVHGLQHYEENHCWDMSLEENKINDDSKEQLARKNGIKHYIIIDCRKSEADWIKNSIMNSKLPTLLNFKEEDIDWLKCHEYACNSLVKVVCDMWNLGIKNAPQIAKQLKMGRGTINRYLKQGAKLGWCDYNPKEEHKKNLDLIHKNASKKVICLNTGEIFNSTRDPVTKYSFLHKSGIQSCCTGKQKTSGIHPITGEPMVWMYYDEYLKVKLIDL
jgi:hypothetical protein